MKVLIACEYSGRVRNEFIKRGHDAISCDLLPTDSPGPHYQGNVFDIINDGFDLMIAHPPCTRLTNSGVRWLNEPPKGRTLEAMWQELDEATAFYRALALADIPKKALENPIMHKYAKKRIGPIARQVIQPWWFGEETFKATGFELHGLPDLIPTNKLNPPKLGTEEHKAWSWVHRASPGPNRWKVRSTTSIGVAQAMAEQWG